MSNERLRVAVIGGGITGLSAAHALSEQARAAGLDLSCTVIERADRWGGKVYSVRSQGFVAEAGPDAILTRKTEALALCRALGIEDKVVHMAGRGAFIRWHDGLLPLPEGLSLLVPGKIKPFVLSPLFTLGGKLRMGAEYLLPPRKEGGDEALGAFVRRRLGNEAVERLADPLLSGIYAGDVDRLSLNATFPQFAEMERKYGGMLRAVIARKRKSSGTAAPGSAKGGGKSVGNGTGHGAGNGTGATGVTTAFFSLEGGIQTLVDNLVKHLGDAELKKGVGVRTIERAGKAQGRKGTKESGYRLHLESGESLDADAVVLAIPAYTCAALLQDIAPAAAKELERIKYASVAGVALGYRRADVAHPLTGTGYVVPRAMRLAVTACTWASSKWSHVAPDGAVLLRCHFGRAGDEASADWDDGKLLAAAREEVGRTLGAKGEPTFERVYRWRRAMPQYEVGHLDLLERVDRGMSQVPGIFAAGSAFRGVGVPDCIRQGRDAAAQALTFLTA